jgi:hypothetical protein
MATCKLCREREADRKNTHYLTDSIIRSCLNRDGSNDREKGMMFDISNNRNAIKARFQRNTSTKVVEKTFGRPATEEEIAEAKEIPFSVNYVFCTPCEAIFTKIENDFTGQVLPKLRGHDFKGTPELSLEPDAIIRLFFLLQVYRTSVCDPGFKISDAFQETLRQLIYSPEPDLAVLSAIPLNITYLNTVGDEKEYTKNTVGIATFYGNQIILFNDFIIQAFEKPGDVKYVDFLGFNDSKTFGYFTNYQEKQFKFKVINHETKVKLWAGYSGEKAANEKVFYRQEYISAYMAKYRVFPPVPLIEAFVNKRNYLRRQR